MNVRIWSVYRFYFQIIQLDLLNSGCQHIIFVIFFWFFENISLANVTTVETELTWPWEEATELELTRLQRQVKP